VSFARFQRYRDSGAEWLGAVPEHWEITRLANLFTEVSEPGSDDLPILSVSIHHGVSDEEMDEEDLDRKVTRSDDRSKYKRVEPNDLVYNMMRAWQGGFGTVTVAGMVSPAYVVARPRYAFDTSYFEQLLRTPTAVEEMRRRSRGVTDFRLRLYWEQFKNLTVTVPPPEEQLTLVGFIRDQTSRFDALINEQRLLIGLLNEKRQAVISHAVTKGLNPDAPMKPSGVEWLGDVPAHWRITCIKHVVQSFEQGWSPQCESRPAGADEWGVLKVGCVNGGTFRPAENKALPTSVVPIAALAIQSGDLLISRANTRELVGNAAVAETNFPRLMLCDKLYRLRFQAHICDPSFVCLFLGTNGARGQIELEATGASASMVNIGQSTILELQIPLPSLDEQKQILHSLAETGSQLEKLCTEAERAIDLLQERRTALISAAVTGQIDVRGLAGAAPNAAGSMEVA
jgi:type I restriction enzyme, S subunit